MSQKRIHIVFNPAAAGGKAGENKNRILSEFRREFGNKFEFSETLSGIDAARIAGEAVEAGYEVIVAVGGDGTINQVVNGILQSSGHNSSQTKLGIISFGTGQGFSQSMGMPKDLASQIRVIKNDFSRYVDVGKINYEGDHSAGYFINEFQLGIGGKLNDSISPLTKKLFGRFAFGYEAVKTLFNYKASEIKIEAEQISKTENVIGVIVANGSYTGGGMKLTPEALLNDGLFDVLIIEDMPLAARLRSFSKIYSGRHIRLPAFKLFRTRELRFVYGNGLSAESDGELIHDKCISSEVIPSALNVISKN
ncbi:MAG TPA: diacylglycerol kinase family lipid kinase [Ignavibacteria bacterium]|nr:diacylglycerol kinase family lipid kinase [Ignavibacteria bacterium]